MKASKMMDIMIPLVFVGLATSTVVVALTTFAHGFMG